MTRLMVLTAVQLRGARAALRLSLGDVARETSLSERTIRRLEAPGAPPNVMLNTLTRLQRYFESRGITFLEDDGRGAGLCCDYPGRRNGA